jgi:hypothetical protein
VGEVVADDLAGQVIEAADLARDRDAPLAEFDVVEL